MKTNKSLSTFISVVNVGLRFRWRLRPEGTPLFPLSVVVNQSVLEGQREDRRGLFHHHNVADKSGKQLGLHEYVRLLRNSSFFGHSCFCFF